MMATGAAVVVVDWSSEDGAKEFARNAGAHVVSRDDERYFHLSAARNLGGHVARMEREADFIAFIDADILLPADFICRATLDPGVILHTRESDGGDTQLWGSCIVPGAAWEAVGYNEELEGYGHEDVEFYSHLLSRGLRLGKLDVAGVQTIGHGDDLRHTNYKVKRPRDVKQQREHHITLFRSAWHPDLK
jgi:hypothetical protein